MSGEKKGGTNVNCMEGARKISKKESFISLLTKIVESQRIRPEERRKVVWRSKKKVTPRETRRGKWGGDRQEQTDGETDT